MIVTAIGLSHKTASLALRERVALTGDELPRALAYLQVHAGHGVIISTCNRTELYFVAEPGQANRETALKLLAGATGANMERLDKHAYFYQHEEAVQHLHRVASGLDSMMFGESEILGQVRSAFQASYEAGLCNAILSRLFHSTIHTARRVQGETFLGRHDRNIAWGVLALAQHVLGDVEGRQVLIVGAGEAGAMTARTLVRHGTHKVVIANRTYRRGATLAEHLGVSAIHFNHVPEAIAETDIVICASGSPTALIQRETLEGAMETRYGRPLLLIDISVPRNIDPSVRDMRGVHLYDIDDLRSMCPAGPEEQAQETGRAQAILDDESERFLAWWRSLQAVPTISALRQRVEKARQQELKKTLRHFPNFDDNEKEWLEALTRALVNKVLHDPITRLKAHGEDQDYLAVTQEIFGLDVSSNGHGPANHTANGAKKAKQADAPVLTHHDPHECPGE